MNKIHNNLIIENLIKTEDFKQLNKEKKEAIVKNLNGLINLTRIKKNKY